MAALFAATAWTARGEQVVSHPPPPAIPAPSLVPPPPPPKPSVLVMPVDTTPGDSVRVILERDFNYGDRLNVVVLDSASRAPLLTAPEAKPDLAELARYGAEFALRVTRRGRTLSVVLYDVRHQRAAHTAVFRTTPDSANSAMPEARLDVHHVADEVERWVTGVRGIAATRVAYVSGNLVHVIDSDGAEDHAVTTGGAALSPAWHPGGRSLVYVDLTDAGTQVARVDLATGKSRLFSVTPRGLNITPVFTPRGDSVVYATVGARGARLVIASATGRGRARPFQPGVSRTMRDLAEPTFSPDGRRVAFVASWPMYPQVYTMRTTGKNLHVHRLVPYTPGLRNERTAPDWSPDGTMIAYQQQNRKFQVWVAQVSDGVANTTIRLTGEGENQDPSWAPDGRHLVLTSTRGGETQLWVMDVRSGRWRQLTHAPGARLAAWSPRVRDVGPGVQRR